MATKMMRSTAIAAILSLPLATSTALAQQQQSGDQSQQPGTAAQEATGQQAGGDAADQPTGDHQTDALVATVGDAEIRGSDVMSIIGMLPPRLQSQPPQMLVPLALEQLILRELILEEARAQNLAADPEVVALVEGAAQGAEEDAMVQVWIDREMANAVTDEAIQQTYQALQPQEEQALPPVEQLRPQIEQHLRQRALQEIRDSLRQDAEVTFYDPSGQPILTQQSDAVQAQEEMQGQAKVGVETAEDTPIAGGWVGVQIQEVTPKIARALGLSEPAGALVSAVEPGSPAAEAGITPGSVIVAVDETEVETLRDLLSTIAEREVGSEVTLSVRTGPQQTEQVAVTIGGRPSIGTIEGGAVQSDESRPRLGVAVAPLSPEAREQLRLPADLEGLLVSRVQEGSPAARADLAQGDVIVGADRTPISDVEALRDAAAAARDEDRPLLLRVYKDGAYSYVPVELHSV